MSVNDISHVRVPPFCVHCSVNRKFIYLLKLVGHFNFSIQTLLIKIDEISRNCCKFSTEARKKYLPLKEETVYRQPNLVALNVPATCEIRH